MFSIDDAHLVAKQYRINGHGHYEDAIFRARWTMEERGWDTELTASQEQCHQHLIYHHYQVKC